MRGSPDPARPRRRWWWLLIPVLIAVGVMVGSHVRSARWLKARVAAYRAAGEPVTLAELERWDRREATNLAAGQAILDALAAIQVVSDTNLPVRGTGLPQGTKLPWSGPVRRAADRYAATNAAADAALRSGLTVPGAAFPLNLRAWPATPLNHLAKLKSGSLHFSLMSGTRADAGDGEAALEDTAAGIRLARTLESEPLLISLLVRHAMLTISVRAMERDLGRTAAGDSSLAKLQLALAAAEKAEADGGLKRSLVAERVLVLRAFEQPTREYVDELVREWGASVTDPAFELPLPQAIPLPVQAWYYRLSGSWRADLEDLLEGLDDLIRAAGSEEAALRRVEEAMGGRLLGLSRSRVVSRRELPIFANSLRRSQRCRALLRCAGTALAVERYQLAEGRLPAALEELSPRFLPAVPADPFADAPLHYLRRPTGYSVYSVGPNGTDDGGRPGKPGEEDGDLVIAVDR